MTKDKIQDYSMTRKFIAAISNDEVLVNHLDKLSNDEKERLLEQFSETLNSEIVTILALCSPVTFGNYIMATQQKQVIQLNMN